MGDIKVPGKFSQPTLPAKALEGISAFGEYQPQPAFTDGKEEYVQKTIARKDTLKKFVSKLFPEQDGEWRKGGYLQYIVRTRGTSNEFIIVDPTSEGYKSYYAKVDDLGLGKYTVFLSLWEDSANSAEPEKNRLNQGAGPAKGDKYTIDSNGKILSKVKASLNLTAEDVETINNTSEDSNLTVYG